jgi:hypothetical protein
MSILGRLGTALIVAGVLGIGALVAWNVFGQRDYGGTCEHSLGCRSFYCIHHELRGGAQVRAAHGACTKSCDADGDCGSGAVCAVLGEEARDDLPPYGKPERACLRVGGP